MIADPHKLGNPDAFDDLADLFLGQMGTVHAHDAALGAIPLARHTDRVNSSARGPITPAERAPGVPRLTLVSDQPAIARVQSAACETKSSMQHAPCVEALILGHLPVMAAAWVGQYVRHAADRLQAPVALARLSGDTLRLELHAPAGCRPEVRMGRGFESALQTIHGAARRVILVVPPGRELESVAVSGLGRVTLLTSGDEAGIVAAYGIIKSVAARLREQRGIDPDSVLRIAVMGAPPGRAEFVIDRLRDAARAFLGLNLQADTCIARIGSTLGQAGYELFEGRFEMTISDLVALVALGPVDAALAGDGLEHEEIAGDEAEDLNGQAVSAAPEAEMASAGPTPDAGAHSQQVLDHEAPAATDTPRAKCAEHGASEVLLSVFVPGLERLAARCPYAEEVELAAEATDGAARRLHVLARAEHYADRSRVLERIAIVAEWVKTHRRVLELTTGDAGWTFEPSEPGKHVFTDQPAAWRRLLDSSLRIHALTPRTPVAHPDWVCVPMN